MKEKIKNIIDIIGLLTIILSIVIFNLIIGANEKDLPILVMCILTGVSFLILVIKKFVYKEKIVKSKTDILVTIFMVTLTLPWIFKTYCTYEGTVSFILKYFFVYAIYLLTRNVVNTKNKVNILISTTICSSLIIIILGLDLQNGKHLYWIIDKLNLRYRTSDRFSSTFGYANAVSSYIAFCVFLSINMLENLKSKKIKIIYFLYIILGSYIIYISYSRVVLILYILILLLYLIYKIYNKIRITKKSVFLICLIGLFLFFCIAIYLIIAMRYSKPQQIKGNWKFRRKFNPGQTYSITFDIDVKPNSNNKEDESNILYITEINKYFNESEIQKNDLKKGNNKINVQITPTKDIYYIKLKVADNQNNNVIMNKCYIDGKEYIFSYKYVPRVIYRLIRSFSLSDDSIVLRKYFYQNSLRIAKDSLIIGQGGDTWRTLATSYAEYPYEVKGTHSYFFELLISYGIVGVSAFVGLIVYFSCSIIKELKSKKENRNTKLCVFIGLMFLIIYSFTFDLCMSFIIILLTVFEFIAILQFDYKEEFRTKVIDYFSICSIGIIFVILLGGSLAKYTIKDLKAKTKFAPYVADYRFEYLKTNKKEDLNYLKFFIEDEPYYQQNYIYSLYWDSINDNLNILPEDEIIKYIDFGIKTFKEVKPLYPFYFSTILERVEIMVDSANKLSNSNSKEIKNKADEVKKVIFDEYNSNLENIVDIKRNHISAHRKNQVLNEYKQFLDKIN